MTEDAICAVCKKRVRADDQAEHLRTQHLGPHYFKFEGREYRTEKPSMSAAAILCMCHGEVPHRGQLVEERGDDWIYYSLGATLDLTHQPEFFYLLPATMYGKPQLKPWDEAALNPLFGPAKVTASGGVGQRLPLDMSPLTPTGEALAGLPWTEKERACIAELMALQDLSEFALIRQAVRTYQLVTLARQREGLTMGFYDADGKRVEYPSMGSKLPPDSEN